MSPAVASSSFAELVTASSRASSQAWARFINSYGSGQQERGDSNGVKPRHPESKTEREQRAIRLRVNPEGEVVLTTGQPLVFSAIPLDQDGMPVHGLQAEWESSNHLAVAIKKTGQAIAGKPGKAILTARAGRLRETIRVTVIPGAKFGGTKRDSSREVGRSGSVTQPRLQNSRPSQPVPVVGDRHHRLLAAPDVPLPLRSPSDDALPDAESSSLYKVTNLIGSPQGLTKQGAPSKGAAAVVTETNGAKNFTFGLPAVSMSGRGLGVNLSLVYNSLVWHKSTDSSSNVHMTYDVDSVWPATGWRISLGQIESQGSYGFTLTDSDGTRHALTYSSAYNYNTTDGSFIHYYGASGWGQLSYPDGTVAHYGAGGGGYRLYPTEIIDRNGNYILISYAGSSGAGPKISSIVDTLGRYAYFYYASNGDLIAITQPGLGTSDVQTMRFYYTDGTIGSSLFGSGISVSGPSPSSTNQDRYFKYDSLSRMIRERQVEQDTNSTYDLSDSLTSNSSWSRKVDYNSSGLVTDAYGARGIHTTLSYDDLNRITTLSYSDSTPTIHYYYDSQSLPSGAPSYTHSYSPGRLLAMTYGSGATGNYFAYDAAGRVVTQKQVTGSTTYGLSYAYNYAGLLTGETYPSGRALSYSYDEGGRLAGLGDGTSTFLSSLSFAAHGGLPSETWGNTAVHAISYNRRLQASQISLSLGSTVLQQYDYGYGEFNTSSGSVDTAKNNGQIGKISSTIGTTAQWNQGFSYDEIGRLSNVSEHQGSSMSTQSYTQGYAYDRYGNRRQSANTTLGLVELADSEINSSRNRLIETGSTVTTYDASGNVTRDLKFRGMDYTYDANGRMTTAERTLVRLRLHPCLPYRPHSASAWDCSRT
jgi:YD repeat-containing protein